MAYGSWQLDLGTNSQSVTATAIVSAEAFGSDKASFAVTASGIASAQALGGDKVALSVTVIGISSAQAFGSDRSSLAASGQGIATGQAIGSDSVTLRLSATGITSGQTFGSDSASVVVLGSGIASAVAFGSGAVSQGTSILAFGIPSSETFGSDSPSLCATALGISSGEAFGQSGSGNTSAIGRPIGASGGGWLSRTPARILRTPKLPTAPMSFAVLGIESQESHGEHVAIVVPVKGKKKKARRKHSPPTIAVTASSIELAASTTRPRAASGIRCRSVAPVAVVCPARIAQRLSAIAIDDSSSVSAPSIRMRFKLHRASRCRRLTRLNTRSAA